MTGFGLAFTVWQVYLARKAAEESKDAASAAHTASGSVRFVDVQPNTYGDSSDTFNPLRSGNNPMPIGQTEPNVGLCCIRVDSAFGHS